MGSWMQWLVIPKITGFTLELRKLIRAILITGALITSWACNSAVPTSPQGPEELNSTRAMIRATATNTTTLATIAEEVVPPASTITITLNSEEIKTERVTPMPESDILTITILYDNHAYDTRLKTAWGFSALIEYHDHVLLFDTGGDGPTLMDNMRILRIDPTRIKSVVLSHIHGDHIGGLDDLLKSGVHPVIYLPPSFPNDLKNQVSRTAEVIEVTRGIKISEDIYSTGEMGRSIREQSLIIDTAQGLVVVTGCAHPGIVEIVDQAHGMFAKPVNLVLGGFHLGSKNKNEIGTILQDFRRIGVQQVAPSHCTGERAIAMFAEEYGEDYIQAGAGKVFVQK